MPRNSKLKSSHGASLIEYGTLAGLVAIVAIAGIAGTGKEVKDIFSHAGAVLGGDRQPGGGAEQVDPEEVAIFVKGIGDTGIQDSSTNVNSSIAPETEVGDLMVAFVMHRSALTTPDGWEVVLSEQADGYAQWLTVLTKSYEAADGSDQAFQQAANGRFKSHILTVGGTDPQVARAGSQAGTTDARMAPSYAVADPAGIVLAASAEVYAATSGNEDITVDQDYTLTTSPSMPANRLAVAWRSTAMDAVAIYLPGATFTDTTTSYDSWSAASVQITPGGRAAEPESFGDYDADVDPANWLILTNAPDTATMSGQPGVLAKDGDDVVDGTTGGEIFIGGPGNDYLRGGRGADTYVYSLGEGDDRIWEDDYSSTNLDRLELRGIAPEDTTFQNVEGDVVIKVTGGGQVLLYYQDDSSNNHMVEQVLFKHAGGEDLYASHQEIRDRTDEDAKATGVVDGFQHSDRYTHSVAGDEDYKIWEFSYHTQTAQPDSLEFVDASIDQTSFIVKDGDYVITVDNGTGDIDTISINDQDNNSTNTFIESYIFTDGTLDEQQARDKAADDAKPTGVIDGTQHSENYFHSVADDEDYKIWDFSYYSQTSQPDALRFVDASIDQTSFIVKDGDYVITVDNGTGDVDTIKINDQDNNSTNTFIESYIFTDGTLNEQQARDKAADDAKPTGVIDGTQHSENYFHSVADDEDYKIWDFSYYSQTSQPDALRFMDASIDQTSFIVKDGDYVITVDNGTGDVDTIKINDQDNNSTNTLIESFIFTDGTLNEQQARDKAASDAKPSGIIDGTQFKENYTHTASVDGSYEIYEFSYFGASESDKLTFTDQNPGDLWVSSDGSDAVLYFDGGSGIVTIDQQFGGSSSRKIETFVFQDGTTWTATDLDNARREGPPVDESAAPMSIRYGLDSPGEPIEIPLTPEANVIIDWGDATANANCETRFFDAYYALCSEGAHGSRTVKITGHFPKWSEHGYDRGYTYSNPSPGTPAPNFWPGVVEDIVAIESWGVTGMTNLGNAFAGAPKLTSVPSTLPATVTKIDGMFADADNFNSANVSNWDTSNVTDMSSVFANNDAFNQPLNWNTSSVTNMARAFQNARAFNQNISSWKTGNVRNTAWMFEGATSFNQPLNTVGASWDLSNVETMQAMFDGATSFNQPLSNWSTPMAYNMAEMFRNTPFNQDISNWETGAVKHIGYMFQDATSFNQDLSGWCVSYFGDKPDSYTGFDVGATSWTLPRPNWGSCPP